MKKYLYFFLSMIVLIVGLILLLVTEFDSLSFSIIILGVVAGLTSFFLLISNRFLERKNSQQNKEVCEHCHKEIEKEEHKQPQLKKEKTEKEEKTVENQQNKEIKSNKDLTSNKHTKTKIVCKYCKCRYSSDKDKCPNCGAPTQDSQK